MVIACLFSTMCCAFQIYLPIGLLEDIFCLHFRHISAVDAAIMTSIVIAPIDSDKFRIIINDVFSINNESEH